MKTNSEYSGLCLNCRQAADCSYRRNHKKPVLFCEEFSYSKIKLDTFFYVANPLRRESKEFKGLCTNCGNNSSCIAEKTKAGVVHCNEYE